VREIDIEQQDCGRPLNQEVLEVRAVGHLDRDEPAEALLPGVPQASDRTGDHDQRCEGRLWLASGQGGRWGAAVRGGEHRRSFVLSHGVSSAVDIWQSARQPSIEREINHLPLPTWTADRHNARQFP
jgi:hypothetical protein